ncbi:hypothetical protein FRC07_001115 [Ceratobasidium sp. 392]|nr:hypothetical protein FRC07_001115 [Ceratobasidium sp. 392]
MADLTNNVRPACRSGGRIDTYKETSLLTMSSPQQPTRNREQSTQPSSNPAAASPSELPDFQPFPAAPREARPRPSSRPQPTSNDPRAPEMIHGGTDQHEALDDRSSSLPDFTPFPSAAPGSRWAPPEGARPEPARPVPPPALASESMQYPFTYRSDTVRYPE